MTAKERYHYLKNRKRCVICQNMDVRTLCGKTMCAACAQTKSKRQIERYMGMKAAHVCTDCGKQDKRTAGGKSRCFACAVKESARDSERYKKKKAATAAKGTAE